MGINKSKLLYLVSEDWYFCSHRLQLACAARDAGYDVIVVTQTDKDSKRITDESLDLIPIKFSRSYKKPWQDIMTLISLFKIYKNVKPDIIHQVALKPVVFGSLVSLIPFMTAREKKESPVIVNALTGLGFIYISNNYFIKKLKRIIEKFLQFILRGGNRYLILQNRDDLKYFIDHDVVAKDQLFLIRGSGVDVNEYNMAPEPDGLVTVVLPSRMLIDKGIMEFVAAANQLKNDNVKARFVLVGDTDPENPTSIRKDVLIQWQKEGIVEWWGKSNNMPEVYRQAHVICLPSYREGLPKVLLEAAACGKPIITTDVPGCREVVINEVNGYLVPPRDIDALAVTMKKLIDSSESRKLMGEKGREIVVNNFTIKQVIQETLELYNYVLSSRTSQIH